MDRIKPRHDLMPATPEEKAEHVGRTLCIACENDVLLRSLRRTDVIRVRDATWLSYGTSQERNAFLNGWREEFVDFWSLRREGSV